MSETVCYLRKGRKLRAHGEIIWREPDGKTKVKPSRPEWGAIIITPDEIEAGKEKPAYTPKQKPASDEKPQRKPRAPKPPPIPRWKQLVSEVRIAQTYGDQFIPTHIAAALADELEASQSLFQSEP